VESSGSGLRPSAGSCEQGISDSIKGGTFFGYLSDCQLCSRLELVTVINISLLMFLMGMLVYASSTYSLRLLYPSLMIM
jgi:hypothetical protein